MPTTIASFNAQNIPEWLQTIVTYISRGQPLYLFLYGALIMFFAFFYTSIVFNPEETAENLKKYGGFFPGIRPGKKTAEYIDIRSHPHHGDRRALPCGRVPDPGIHVLQIQHVRSRSAGHRSSSWSA